MYKFLPLLLSVPSFAASISYTSQFPLPFDGTPTPANTQTTNWNQLVSLQQFNPLLGTLTGVTLSLTGGVYGNVQLESLDATPALINYSLASQVTATGLSGLNVVVLPTASGTFSATAHDGTTDFAGGSGVSLTGLSNTASDTSTSTNGAVLAAYTGAGTFNVALAALGQSSSSGAGNLLASFNTNAGALVTVTYDYDDGAPAPEPATMVFVGAGLIAVGYFQRRGR